MISPVPTQITLGQSVKQSVKPLWPSKKTDQVNVETVKPPFIPKNPQDEDFVNRLLDKTTYVVQEKIEKQEYYIEPPKFIQTIRADINEKNIYQLEKNTLNTFITDLIKIHKYIIQYYDQNENTKFKDTIANDIYSKMCNTTSRYISTVKDYDTVKLPESPQEIVAIYEEVKNIYNTQIKPYDLNPPRPNDWYSVSPSEGSFEPHYVNSDGTLRDVRPTDGGKRYSKRKTNNQRNKRRTTNKRMRKRSKRSKTSKKLIYNSTK